MTTLKTRAQVRKQFDRLGMTVARWARENQCSATATYQVLYGKHKGVRGEAAVDKEALVDLLLNLSCLVEAYPQLAELDLNPVIAYDDGYAVVDARIIVNRANAR